MPERIIPTDTIWWRQYGWEHLQRYYFASKYCKSLRVLDFGCGVGYGTDILECGGASRVIGMDIDPPIIDSARLRADRIDQQNFCTSLDEAVKANNGEPFDVVVMFEVLEHVLKPTEILSEIANQIKLGGTLIVSAPNRLQFSDAANPIENEFHLSEPSYDELRQWVGQRFQSIRDFEQSEVKQDFKDYVVATLQNSWLLRGERFIRRLIRRPLLVPELDEDIFKRTEIFPLIQERREICQQFILVATRDQ